MKRASSSLFVFVLLLGIATEALAQARPQRPGPGEQDRGDRYQPVPIPQQPIPQSRPQPIPRPEPIPQPQPMPYPGQGHHDPYRPGPQYPIPRERQVMEGSLVSLRVDQYVRGQIRLELGQLLRIQYGLTFEGAEIQRVVVEGQSLERYGRPATASVILNGRFEGRVSDLDPYRGRAPIPLNSFEEVRAGLQGLQVVIQGEARIDTIHVRVGRVRPLRMY